MLCLNPFVVRLYNYELTSINSKKNQSIQILGSLKNFLVNSNIELFNKILADPNYILIPCRKCINCKKNRSIEFSRRSAFEFQNSDKNCFNIFLTLTYNDDYDEYYRPYLPHNDRGIPTLLKKDLQDFIKRLRKSQSKFNESQIRYLAVGEYGSKTFRPHYHLIIYNVIFPVYDMQLVSNNNNNPIYTNEYFTSLWSKGNISFSIANDYTVKYVCNYQLKSDSHHQVFKDLDVQKPFLINSKFYGYDSDEFDVEVDNLFSNTLNNFKFGDKVIAKGMLEYYKKKYQKNRRFVFDSLRSIKEHYLHFDKTSLNTLNNLEQVNLQKILERSF